jgi:hypothetical protein
VRNEEIRECINFLEQHGIIFLTMLYDSDDFIFADGLCTRARPLIPFERGVPSATHRMIDAIVSHPKLKNIIDSLAFFPSFKPPQKKTINGISLIVYLEGNNIAYAHTISYYFFKLYLKGSLLNLPKEGLEIFLRELREHLKESSNDIKPYEYWNSISRLISLHSSSKLEEEYKRILKGELRNIIGDFLNYLDEKNISDLIKIKKKDEEEKRYFFGSHIFSCICEIYFSDPDFFENNEEYRNKINRILLSLNNEVEKKYMTEDIIRDEDGNTEFEATFAFLYGYSLLIKLYLLASKNFPKIKESIERTGLPLSREEFIKKVQSCVNKFQNIKSEFLHSSLMASFSFKWNKEELERHYGNIEFTDYISASIAYYLLKLSATLRDIFNLNDFPLPFPEDEIIGLCYIKKGI